MSIGASHKHKNPLLRPNHRCSDNCNISIDFELIFRGASFLAAPGGCHAEFRFAHAALKTRPILKARVVARACAGRTFEEDSTYVIVLNRSIGVNRCIDSVARVRNSPRHPVLMLHSQLSDSKEEWKGRRGEQLKM